MGTIGFLVGLLVGLIVGISRAVRKRDEDNNDWIAAGLGIVWFIGIWIVFVVLTGVARIYTSILIMQELRYLNVWLTQFGVKAAIFAASGLFAGIFMAVNLAIAWHGAAPIHERAQQRSSWKYDKWQSWTKAMKWIGRAVVLAFAVVFGLVTMASGWETVLRFFGQIPFGVSDPIHSLDVGYYVLTVPFITLVMNCLLWTFMITLLAVFGLQIFLRKRADELNTNEEKDAAFTRGFGQFCSLCSMLFLLWGWRLILSPYFLMINGSSGRLVGASWIDINYRMGVAPVIGGLVALFGLIQLINGRIRNWIIQACCAGLPILIVTIVLGIIPWAVHGLSVSPSELAYETPYIANHIAMTRAAYGIDKLEGQAFPYQAKLTADEYRANDDTLAQARTIDYRQWRTAVEQLQEFRPSYTFHDGDIDRYPGIGQVILSPRETDPDQLPQQAQTWINRLFQYTHGFGYTGSTVNGIGDQGMPLFIASNIPVEAPEVLQTQQPRIYFGEVNSEPAIVNIRDLKEVDYASEAGIIYGQYEGSAGIRLAGLNRLAFAINYGDLKILLSRFITRDSKIIVKRTITERVSAIAPFLTYDADPYAVVTSQGIFWIWDAYTIAGSYPYADPISDQNSGRYIRNSVKVVIDAYNGTTTFYAADPADPILHVWNNLFPGMFRPLAEMPAVLRQHLRYPEDLFMIQAKKLALYHMTDPTSFYNREDLWVIPNELYDQKPQEMAPRFVWMRLPGKTENEFVITLPFVPFSKQNLVGWMAARMDRDHYGELVLWLFPRNQTVIGPAQAEAQINQDTTISQDLSLWNQQGSAIPWGNMIPLTILGQEGGSVVYIKPLYIMAKDSKIPALARVIIVTSNRVIATTNLQEALADLYAGKGSIISPSEVPPATEVGVTPIPPVPGATKPMSGSAGEIAIYHYDAAQKCAGSGDWECFGREMKALGEALDQLP